MKLNSVLWAAIDKEGNIIFKNENKAVVHQLLILHEKAPDDCKIIRVRIVPVKEAERGKV